MTSAPNSHILIVDDDPTFVKLLEGILRDNHYAYTSVHEAAQGLQMAMAEKPSLIILDVMMPVINGYNFCHILKSQAAYKQIPVILLTSRDEKEDLEIGRKVGADAYLTKPLNTPELLNTLKKFLK